MRAYPAIHWALAVGLWLAGPAVAQTVQTFNASGTWTAPAGVASVLVRAWGGGGGGATNGNQGGGGGGGGAYASATIPVVPGVTYSITVGPGGAAGMAGGASQFASGTAVKAAGGGAASDEAAGTGGSLAASVGTTEFAGGNGGNGRVGGGPLRGGGGGGGSATTIAAGSNGTAGGGGTGGAGGAGTGSGGAGGNDAANGKSGNAPGGGGGGAGASGSVAGAGAAGRITLTYLAQVAEYRFDEAAWAGTVGEVADSSGNGYNATRGGGATTASGTPAFTLGSQNTCGYGQFDQSGSPRSFVQLPGGFPSLSSSFTITAWIRTTNVSKAGQRIVVRDDDSNGWALSVSDEVAGTLRLFNRSISYTAASLTGGGAVRSGNVALDTPVVIANNTWYFVAASADLTGKVITLYVYNAAGTQLAKTSASYTGTWGAGTGATSIGNETSASPENGLYFHGNLDEVRVYQPVASQTEVEAIRTLVRTCPVTAPHHLQIEHPSGNGVTCATDSFTVRACADAACSVPYTSGVTGTLSSGNGAWLWPGGANFSISAGSSSTTLAGRLPVVGTSLLSVASSVPAATNTHTCNFGSPSCTYSAANAGFLLSLANHVAETSTPLTVSAVRASDNDPAVCVPAWGNVTRTLTLSCGYINPNTGTLAVRLDGSALNASNSAVAACGSASLNASFNASGQASFTALYADVGQLSLNASYTGSAGTGDAGLSMSGGTSFVAAPKDFKFSAIPAGPFTAGVDFGLTVTARNNAGNATPNFGREGESATLARTLISPTGAGAQAGNLSGSLSFTNGVASPTTLSWDEVGFISLSATLSDGNYLDSGLSATGSSAGEPNGQLGPFRPHHFRLVATPACGTPASFSYAGQPFSLTVTAYNGLATPGRTLNYDGSAATSPNHARQLSFSEAVSIGAGSFSPSTWPATTFVAGEASSQLAYGFTNKLTVPQVLKLRATDADGVSSGAQPLLEPSMDLRSGRVLLAGGMGSAKQSLRLALRIESWSAQKSWILSTADTCTSLGAAQVALSGQTGLNGAAGAWTHAISVTGPTSGLGTVTLSAPNPAAAGTVNVAINLGDTATDAACLSEARPTTIAGQLAWLRSRHGSTAPCNNRWTSDPSARASFGAISPESQRRVHERQVY